MLTSFTPIFLVFSPKLKKKVKFLTKIYHPNVKSDGNFCTDIITSEGWSPQIKIQQGFFQQRKTFEHITLNSRLSFTIKITKKKTVLLTIRQLLSDPNLETPLSPEIAELYKVTTIFALTTFFYVLTFTSDNFGISQTDKQKFIKTAKETTKQNASPKWTI